MSLFTCVIEGRLTASPTCDHTRDGRPYVQFPLVHRDRYRDATGRWVDTKAMFFEVLCWGDLATRVHHLTRGDQVLVEAGQLLPYLNDSDLPALKVQARNVPTANSSTTDDRDFQRRRPRDPWERRRARVIRAGQGRDRSRGLRPVGPAPTISPGRGG
ncbi:MAG: single-stranded DNA-binding protein [Micromonosporaceae bacterium]|nr:single-stranded DNA-binding protein [Micromonosporaceae bacterium]